MKKLSLALFAVVSLTASVAVVSLTASVALAEVKTDPDLKVSMDTPAGWKSEAVNDRLVLTDPKNEISFFVEKADGASVDKAMEKLLTDLKGVMPDVKKTQKATPTKLNGMDAFNAKMEGTINKEPWKVGVMIVKSPTGKFLIVAGAMKAATAAAHQKEAQGFLGSIKPAP